MTPQRNCLECGIRIADSAPPRQIFCSDAHKMRFHRRMDRVARFWAGGGNLPTTCPFCGQSVPFGYLRPHVEQTHPEGE